MTPFSISGPFGRPTPLVLAALVACLVPAGIWALLRPTPLEEPALRAGAVMVPELLPLTIARNLGALDSTHIQLVDLETFEEERSAFLDGNLRIAVLPFDDALRFAGPPMRARVVRVLGLSRVGYTLLGVSDARDVAGLRGGRVGLESGRRAMATLRGLLQDAGLTLADVRPVLVDADGAEEALEAGSVDAVLAYPPVSDALAAAGAPVLARAEPDPPGEPFVLVATPGALRHYPRRIDRIGTMWDLGLAHIRRASPAQLDSLAAQHSTPPERIRQELAQLTFLNGAEDARLRSAAGRAEVQGWVDIATRRWEALGLAERPLPIDEWLVPARGERR